MNLHEGASEEQAERATTLVTVLRRTGSTSDADPRPLHTVGALRKRQLLS